MHVPEFLKPTVALAFADRRTEYDGTNPPSMEDRVVSRAPCRGAVEWIDLLEGVNLHEAMDEESGLISRIVVPSRSHHLDARIEIAGKRIELAPGAVIVRSSGEVVDEGEIVAWEIARKRREEDAVICVLEGVTLDDTSIEAFEKSLSTKLAARVRFVDVVYTLPSKDEAGREIPGTGGRSDVLVSVPVEDCDSAFESTRLTMGIRLLEDALSVRNNRNGLIYPERIRRYLLP